MRVSFDRDTVSVEVANDPGSRRPAPLAGAPQGLGLVGMRERVALLGGRMSAGPTQEGGFVVRVEIPERFAAAGPPATGRDREGDVSPAGRPTTGAAAGPA